MDASERTVLVPLHADHWLVVNDGVMGGRSQGTILPADNVEAQHGPPHVDEALVFAGILNTNGGGFSSIRSRGLGHPLIGHRGLRLRVWGDGRRYACDVRAAPRISGSGVTWKAEFLTQAQAWMNVELPFAEFVPTWRGRVLDLAESGGRASFLEEAGSIGFTIADGRDGPFRLAIGALETYT